MADTLVLDKRLSCDLELIQNGGFSPLRGFMKKKDYQRCLDEMKLDDGSIWPFPMVLSITEDQKDLFDGKNEINLIDETNLILARMDISNKEESIYLYNWEEECKKVYGTIDTNHPYVKIVKNNYDLGKIYHVGGNLTWNIEIPHYDFTNLRLNPKDTKKYFEENGWKTVVGFQTRNPMHRAHYELTKYCLEKVGEDAKLLLHPVVGITQDCDIDYHSRVRCYKHMIKYYPEGQVLLSLLPLSMRMAGPREAVMHAIIRKNYGCTHFIVGRDHAGPSYKTKDGESFYGPYEAQDLLLSVAEEIGIEAVTSKAIVYVEPKDDSEGKYLPMDEVNEEECKVVSISGTEQRRMLENGEEFPEWFSFPEVIEELSYVSNPPQKQGLCVYFVGLPASGKSTLANSVADALREKYRDKKVDVLDADEVRRNLSKGLGFSKEDRSTNVRRIGYLASKVVRHGGIVCVANISPYEEDRLYNRDLISREGRYVQVWVDTSLYACEKRDPKGLYKKARDGVIKGFTGIDDPFESATDSDVVLEEESMELQVQKVVEFISRKNN